jgi:hypothetical protein
VTYLNARRSTPARSDTPLIQDGESVDLCRQPTGDESARIHLAHTSATPPPGKERYEFRCVMCDANAVADSAMILVYRSHCRVAGWRTDGGRARPGDRDECRRVDWLDHSTSSRSLLTMPEERSLR